MCFTLIGHTRSCVSNLFYLTGAKVKLQLTSRQMLYLLEVNVLFLRTLDFEYVMPHDIICKIQPADGRSPWTIPNPISLQHYTRVLLKINK